MSAKANIDLYPAPVDRESPSPEKERSADWYRGFGRGYARQQAESPENSDYMAGYILGYDVSQCERC
jgi:hypothetical protein